MEKSIGIIGIGNVLMADDGVGPLLIRLLEAAYLFPSEVALLDAGTSGMDLTALLYDLDQLIVVDTVRVAGKAGTVIRFDREALLEKSPVLPVSPHDPGLREALLTLQLVDGRPQKVVLIGVIPEKVDLGLELSDSVHRAIPKIIEEVLSELVRSGITAEKKGVPDIPDIWWKKKQSLYP